MGEDRQLSNTKVKSSGGDKGVEKNKVGVRSTGDGRDGITLLNGGKVSGKTS